MLGRGATLSTRATCTSTPRELAILDNTSGILNAMSSSSSSSSLLLVILPREKVEEDNEPALAFYRGLGFDSLFVDRAARRYDTSGFLLQNVRTSKLTMRKVCKQNRRLGNSRRVFDVQENVKTKFSVYGNEAPRPRKNSSSMLCALGT